MLQTFQFEIILERKRRLIGVSARVHVTSTHKVNNNSQTWQKKTILTNTALNRLFDSDSFLKVRQGEVAQLKCRNAFFTSTLCSEDNKCAARDKPVSVRFQFG